MKFTGEIMILRFLSPSGWGEAVDDELTYVMFTTSALIL